MSKIRVPRPFYFEHGVIEYFVSGKQIHYKVWKWNDVGIKETVIDQGLLGDKTSERIVRGLQSLSIIKEFKN